MRSIYSAFWIVVTILVKAVESCNFVFLSDFQMLLVCEVDVSNTCLYDPKCPSVNPWSAHLHAQYELQRTERNVSANFSDHSVSGRSIRGMQCIYDR